MAIENWRLKSFNGFFVMMGVYPLNRLRDEYTGVAMVKSISKEAVIDLTGQYQNGVTLWLDLYRGEDLDQQR